MNNTTSPTPQEPPKALPTFALPSELRRMIYQHLLNRTPHKTMLLYFDSFPNNRYLDLHPAILRVSRRTYTDAVPLLYGANTFEIYLNGRPSRGDNDPPLDRCRRPANFLRPPQQQDYNPVLLLRCHQWALILVGPHLPLSTTHLAPSRTLLLLQLLLGLRATPLPHPHGRIGPRDHRYPRPRCPPHRPCDLHQAATHAETHHILRRRGTVLKR